MEYEINNILNNFKLSEKIGEQNNNIKDEIDIYRKHEDDLLDMGDWNRDLQKANWLKIIELSIEYLSKTRDLFILNRLCEAITCEFGFAGFSKSLELLYIFLNNKNPYYPDKEEYKNACLNWIHNRLPTYLFENDVIKKRIINKNEDNLEYFSDNLRIINDQIKESNIFPNLIKDKLNKLFSKIIEYKLI